MMIRIPRRVKKTSNRGRYGKMLAEINKREAKERDEKMRPILMDAMLRANGKKYRMYQALADTLNDQGVVSARGDKWSRETVRRLMKRLGPEFMRDFRAAYMECLKMKCSDSNTSICPDLWGRELRG